MTTGDPHLQATPLVSTPSSAAHDPAAYGERTAGAYDELYADAFDTEAAADFLTDLTGHGRLLDLGAGTGRLLVPLAERGARVEGIEASTAMIARLRRSVTGRALTVHHGDFGAVDAPGPYQVIVAAVSTLYMLVDQDAQLRRFANVAARLCPGGYFVVEAFVPDPSRYDRDGLRTELRSRADQNLHLVTSRHDPLQQRVHIEHVCVGPGGLRRYPVTLRYAWPSELDVMAAAAGLTMHARWGGWRRQPFTADTTDHVTLYRRPFPARGTAPIGAPPRPGAGRGRHDPVTTRRQQRKASVRKRAASWINSDEEPHRMSSERQDGELRESASWPNWDEWTGRWATVRCVMHRVITASRGSSPSIEKHGY